MARQKTVFKIACYGCYPAMDAMDAMGYNVVNRDDQGFIFVMVDCLYSSYIYSYIYI